MGKDGKKIYKDSNARAEPLFFSNLLFGDVRVAVAVVAC